ncbi:RING finger domain-containing protein [Cardinium endosymbiont of Nabis limbatus]|uniref:RING finger domain-containing protein n=1 Tax=Cardinium endosymbiont of Nabis limbatus TaxID=3066217 RepID=UPI003AF3C3CD
MQYITYSRQLFVILALFGFVIFSSGSCFKGIYSSGEHGLDDGPVRAGSSACAEAHRSICCARMDPKKEVELSNDDCELIRNFCILLMNAQKRLTHYIKTAFKGNALTEKEIFITDYVFQFASVAFTSIAKLQAAETSFSRFRKLLSDVLHFVIELNGAKIVPNEFVQFLSNMLGCMAELQTAAMSPREMIEGLIAQLTRDKEQVKWLEVGADVQQQQKECAICFEKLKGGVTALPCDPDHIFHFECIWRWVRSQVPPPSYLCAWSLRYFYWLKKPTCPLCRESFSPDRLVLISDYFRVPTW